MEIQTNHFGLNFSLLYPSITSLCKHFGRQVYKMVALAHLAVVKKSMFLLRASSTTAVVFELL